MNVSAALHLYVYLPDCLSLSQVVQWEENVRVLSDAVVGEALQVDQQVVRYWNSARLPVALPGTVPLENHHRNKQFEENW